MLIIVLYEDKRDKIVDWGFQEQTIKVECIKKEEKVIYTDTKDKLYP